MQRLFLFTCIFSSALFCTTVYTADRANNRQRHIVLRSKKGVKVAECFVYQNNNGYVNLMNSGNGINNRDHQRGIGKILSALKTYGIQQVIIDAQQLDAQKLPSVEFCVCIENGTVGYSIDLGEYKD